ncbi:MAG: amidohydrolase family protein, partial [Acetobacteraceae bacterium]|nr:amidohydrolase family protein [Acetobacteraceae bacterium]
PHAGSAARVLRAATRDAALALGRDDLGRITPGATADLLLFDLSGPRYQPVWDPLKALVTNGSAGDIGMVMVDGRILLADGTITTTDEAAVTRRGAAAIAGAWQQAEALGAIPPAIRARAAH